MLGQVRGTARAATTSSWSSASCAQSRIAPTAYFTLDPPHHHPPINPHHPPPITPLRPPHPPTPAPDVRRPGGRRPRVLQEPGVDAGARRHGGAGGPDLHVSGAVASGGRAVGWAGGRAGGWVGGWVDGWRNGWPSGRRWAASPASSHLCFSTLDKPPLPRRSPSPHPTHPPPPSAESDYFGKTEVVELAPGGRDARVTEANKRRYVDLVARHRMTGSIKAQIKVGLWCCLWRRVDFFFGGGGDCC
jgi:hypothetical protein